MDIPLNPWKSTKSSTASVAAPTLTYVMLQLLSRCIHSTTAFAAMSVMTCTILGCGTVT